MTEQRYILYADDDFDDRELLQDMFRAYPAFTFVSFADGMELLEFLQKRIDAHICLVILDINMPRMSGLQALGAIREHDNLKELPVVVFTTSSSPHDEAAVRERGAVMFTKPPNLERLQQVTQKMLAHSPCEKADT
ncbi:response regulator [Flaviaesturariibacter amylovorans]|uniref:Response regulator n=1 Tax=Flaviaesturariibacter amylovorans TaxID=1084520 RepID=A0ABP8H4Y1_9BACT